MTSPHENITCQVGIHAQPTERGVRFRALALECLQEGPWRASQVEAEVDAERMDAHQCPLERNRAHQRRVPTDRVVTKRDALYLPASAMRYVPQME